VFDLEGLQWFRISRTSTSKYRVFPPSLGGLIVIYVEGCEREVADFPRRNSHNVPRKALLYLLKSLSVPERLYNLLQAFRPPQERTWLEFGEEENPRKP